MTFGCSNGSNENAGGGSGGATPSVSDRDAALTLLGPASCNDALETFYDGVTSPAAWQASMRGDIVRCAFDRKVSLEEMLAHFQTAGMPQPTLTTGAYKFRVAYWTERQAGQPVLTTGALYVPETRRADPSPLVVAGHGSVGLADKCAPSREDPEGALVSFRSQMYTFAGDGWVVLAPDYPGLGTPGATTWMFSPDEGHALLDATRAARKLAKKGFFSDKNAIVGHSNGGHAALSAQSYAKTYGTDGTVEVVMAFSPFWLSNGAWGGLISPLGNSLVTPTLLWMAIQYFYGHLAMYEGIEHGTDAFLPEHAQAMGKTLETQCWQGLVENSLNFQKGVDAFTSTYITEVGGCGAANLCNSELAKTWKQRWVIDRPQVDPTLPIVLWQGQNDDFLTPGFQKCGIDRLTGQNANLTVCIDPNGNHSSLISGNADWLRASLGAYLLGGSAPAPCTGLEVFNPPLTCSAPIPNSVDPAEP